MEPWLNGKRPMQFSTSLSHTQQFLYNPITRDADKIEDLILQDYRLAYQND